MVASTASPFTSVIVYQYSSQGILHLQHVRLPEAIQDNPTPKLFNMILGPHHAQHAPGIDSAALAVQPDRDPSGTGQASTAHKPRRSPKQQAQVPGSGSGNMACLSRGFELKLLVGQHEPSNAQPSIFSSAKKTMDMHLLNMAVSVMMPDDSVLTADCSAEIMAPCSASQGLLAQTSSMMQPVTSSSCLPDSRSSNAAVKPPSPHSAEESQIVMMLQSLRSHLDNRLDHLDQHVQMLSHRMQRIEQHLGLRTN